MSKFKLRENIQATRRCMRQSVTRVNVWTQKYKTPVSWFPSNLAFRDNLRCTHAAALILYTYCTLQIIYYRCTESSTFSLWTLLPAKYLHNV